MKAIKPRRLQLLLTIVALGILSSGAYAQVEAKASFLPAPEYWFGRQFIEFRARGGSISGHAYIVFGWEYPNGAVHYYDGAGFYPEEHKSQILTQLNQIAGPGHVLFKPASDWRVDSSIRVYVNEEQERIAQWIVRNWDSKSFRLPASNCTTLMNDVASSVGMKTPSGFESLLVWTPRQHVRFLRQHNDAFTGVRHYRSGFSDLMGIRKRIAQDLARYDSIYDRGRISVASDRDPGYRVGGSRGEPPVRPNDPTGGGAGTGSGGFGGGKTGWGFTPVIIFPADTHNADANDSAWFDAIFSSQIEQ